MSTSQDLLHVSRWAPPDLPEMGVAVVNDSSSRWTHLVHLADSYQAVSEADRKVLNAAMTTLSQSVTAQGAPGPVETQRIQDALEVLGPYASTDPSGPAAAFIESVDAPDIRGDLTRAMISFVDKLALSPLRSAASFSFILFRKSDHGGAVYASFQQGKWPASVSSSKKEIDTHLALIPPPTAEGAVTALAGDLGISPSQLPCVVFVGREPATSADSPLKGIGNSLAAWPLKEGSSYTDQLRHIYSQLYATDADALLGRQSVSIFDRLIMERRWIWLGIAVGIAFGPKGLALYGLLQAILDADATAEAINSGLQAVGIPPKMQLNPGTVVVFQNGQSAGEVFTEQLGPTLFREHWFLFQSFDRSQDYEIKWKLPGQWDANYVQFKARMLGLPQSQGNYTYLRSEANYHPNLL